MKHRISTFIVATSAVFTIAGCSSDTRRSITTDVQSAVTDISAAVDKGANNAAEALARNIATQQGEEQFKNAKQELSGPLACDATIQDGVAKIAINCTGKTKAGGAAVLTGTTNEIPGASVVSLDGQFTGTVDGAQVFTTQRLGG